MNPNDILRKYYGYPSFRPGQGEVVSAILEGRDALAIMPTGAGKSICYQVPALAMDGVALVISPLISLMKDQVGALLQMGVRAAYLNSSLTFPQYRKALQNCKDGVYKIIYVAPERLGTEGFLSFAQQANISLVAVDEAHCVSQWGHDFRPSYLQIPAFLEALPRRPVLAAFTATATAAVRGDVLKVLGLQDPLCITTGFDRQNLYFGVETPKSKMDYVRQYVRQNGEKSGIVYCSTRKAVEQVCQSLVAAGVDATRYHAGLSDEERRQNQEDFLYDRSRVMVATNAFGMGIDKSNVSYVLHYNMPKNMESYYQEAGRAGRDGSPAECILLYSGQDVRTALFFIDQSFENPDTDLTPQQVEQLRVKEYDKLRQMQGYCTATGCLRQYILRYFGEHAPDRCGNCSSCLGDYTEEDISEAASLILQAVRSVRGRFGAGVIGELLKGSETARIQRFSLAENPLFGSLSHLSGVKIKGYISALCEQDILQTTEGQYPLLRLGEGARAVLEEGEPVIIRQKRVERRAAADDFYDPALFQKLRALRAQIARRQSVPAYVVFTDATLKQISALQPTTPAQLLEVPGVGESKLGRYGELFLEAIAAFREEEK